MFPPRLTAVLLAAAALGLGGCSTYDGYGRYSAGYGSGYYGSSYYGGPHYGWYDGFYYPGTGYYVFDRAGQRHRWNARQQRYWQARRHYRGDRQRAVPDRRWRQERRPDARRQKRGQIRRENRIENRGDWQRQQQRRQRIERGSNRQPDNRGRGRRNN